MKIRRISGKTWRDRKDQVILYHASPNRLTALSPRSDFYGMSGLYLSPNYKSIARDWAEYVIGRRSRKHPAEQHRREWADRIYDLEEKESLTEQEQKELENLKDRRRRTEEKMQNEEYKRSVRGYSRIYVHKISCPKDVYEKAKKLFNDAYEAGYLKGAIGFWAWGDQIFIPAEDLPRLKIISAEEWDEDTVAQKSNEAWRPRYRSQPAWPKPDPDMKVPKWEEKPL